jgi:hydrogenase maturation protein HypF
MKTACSIRVRGVVQGVGFRPFVYRLARANTLTGWVLNGDEGVEIHVEGTEERLDAFLRDLRLQAPAASAITEIAIDHADPAGLAEFTIRASQLRDRPTARISPDLAVCDQCVGELFDPKDPRFAYPYINCTDCGPRYSIITALPYDRASTTMAPWAMDETCAHEYHNPASRRFHAQPVACPTCGPHYLLHYRDEVIEGDREVVQRAASLLLDGAILAIKGLGGYHLACDARQAEAVAALRERKYRKERPFALMARNLEVARELAEFTIEAEVMLTGPARPIVLVPAKRQLPYVAPDNAELGLMLPYTPLHHLLFAAGAPDVLIMTSANRSSEPIAYDDEDALTQLADIVDGFLVGERPIARRVEDSVVRSGALGPVILRRSRGYAPGAVTAIPSAQPVLAVGADLKNAVTLVVDGQAFVSQHVGDLDHYPAFRAFEETIRDLLSMYAVEVDDLLLVRDCHPQYLSTRHALELGAHQVRAIQHHRAHVASVLAERGAWESRVLGVSLDGTGYGDDGTIWGTEFFVGSVVEGLERVAHLRPAALVGGDAAALHPVQAAAGFLAQVDGLPPMDAGPFAFPGRYRDTLRLLESGTRVFSTTSAGRLFDTAAALVGFTRPVTFEGQAAIWLEQLARRASSVAPYAFPFRGQELDFRPLLRAVVDDRIAGRDVGEIARAFHAGVAHGLRDASVSICHAYGLDTVVASGGVFQNMVLVEELKRLLDTEGLELWTNCAVPPNDGGISLGQAALAALEQTPCTNSPSR